MPVLRVLPPWRQYAQYTTELCTAPLGLTVYVTDCFWASWRCKSRWQSVVLKVTHTHPTPGASRPPQTHMTCRSNCRHAYTPLKTPVNSCAARTTCAA